MKSTRSDAFFSAALLPPKKRARNIIKHQGQMLDMPNEIWVEVLKSLNKKDLRKLAQVNSFFHQLIAAHNLFDKACWPSINYGSTHLSLYKSFNIAQCHSRHSLFELKNGDVVIGGKQGEVYMLKLRQNAWKYLCAPSPEGQAIHDAILLTSGHLLICEETRLRIWHQETQQLIQHLQLDDQDLLTKFERVIELKNGDLLTASTTNSIHLWKKNHNETYQPHLLNIPNLGQERSRFFVTDDLLLIQDELHITLWQLSLSTCRQVKVTDIKNRIARALVALMNDENFVSAYAFDVDIENIDQFIANPSTAMLGSTPKDMPRKCLLAGNLIIWASGARFMVNLFNSDIIPYFLGFLGVQHHIKCINEQILVTRGKNILPLTDNESVEILSDWNNSTNKFNRCTLFFSQQSLPLDDGLVLVQSESDKTFTYNAQSNTTQGPSINLSRNTMLGSLQSNALISVLYGEIGNQFTIWDRQTGISQTALYSKSDTYVALANGDLLFHEYKDDTDSSNVYVHRFSTQ